MFQTTDAREDGFTLVEMLVVMALLAIAAAAGSVWLLDVPDRMKVARMADRIEQVLLRLGSEAARAGEDRSAVIKGHVLSTPDARLQLAQDVTLRWTTAIEATGQAEAPTIIFFATGGASGGTLELSKGRVSAVIEVGWLDARVRRAR
jgi:general secretion pathway protein H